MKEQHPSGQRVKKIVTKTEAEHHASYYKRYVQIMEKQEQQFTTSKHKVYYIVSTKFIEQWKQFTMSEQMQRIIPQEMNRDLFTSQGVLKQNLKQGEEFVFVPSEAFKFLTSFVNNKLKRRVVFLGEQKRVPIYTKTYRHIVLTKHDLRQVDYNRRTSEFLQLKKINLSQDNTIQDLIYEIAETESIRNIEDIKMWYHQCKKFEANDLFKFIYNSVKPSRDYIIKWKGKKLDPKLKLGDIEFENDDYFITQKKETMSKFFLQSDGQSKCQGCYQLAELKFECPCKKVAYCSEACKQRDKRFHLNSCDYSELEELQNLNMTLTSDSSRGLVGLSNIGNTCFMNSCLQCLSHTLPLTQYFLNKSYEAEINTENPIGTGGKLAKHYAKFIQQMWVMNNRTFTPSGVKRAVSRKNQMFSGYAQHDSQQFFSFLVDGLHEDLNRILKKPYVEAIESKDRDDEIVAQQSWIAYIKRNESIVTDLMTGQYKSRVTCPDCKIQSITFDPFLTVTLPIPQTQMNVFDMYIFSPEMNEKTKKMSFSYANKSAEDWLQKAGELIKAEVSTFNLYVVTTNEGIYKIGKDSMSEIIHKLDVENKYLFLMKKTDEELRSKNLFQFTVQCSKKYYYQEYDNLWVKFPMLVENSKITGKTLAIKMLRFLYGQAYKYRKYGIFKQKKTMQQYLKQMTTDWPFKLVLRYDKKMSRIYTRLQFKFESQKQIQADTDVSELIADMKQGDYEFDFRFKKDCLHDFEFERLRDFDQVGKKIKTTPTDNCTVDIRQCFESLRTPEQLEAGNQWYCPQCKDHKLAMKQMNLYKAPEILIIHLKRFKQKGLVRKEKNESKVIFPMQLDMGEYLLDHEPMCSYNQAAKKQKILVDTQHRWIDPKGKDKKPIYQLYAVCNHFGGLGGGHYTASARNDGKWYSFNDSSVRRIDESDICYSGAYMLFYKRIGQQ